jgi:hypothetical protein
VEGSETVTVTLSSNSTYALGSPSSATITIADNDFIPTVSITGGSFTFDGNPHGATAFAYGNGGVNNVLSPSVTISYQGTGGALYGPTASAPTNVGSYIATATFAGNANYLSASNSTTININAAAATLTLGALAQVYDGTTNYLQRHIECADSLRKLFGGSNADESQLRSKQRERHIGDKQGGLNNDR